MGHTYVKTNVRNGYNKELTAGINLEWRFQANGRFKCPHIHDGMLPRTLWILTDGGNGGDYVCLDCLLEWVEQHKSEIGL